MSVCVRTEVLSLRTRELAWMCGKCSRGFCGQNNITCTHTHTHSFNGQHAFSKGGKQFYATRNL